MNIKFPPISDPRLMVRSTLADDVGLVLTATVRSHTRTDGYRGDLYEFQIESHPYPDAVRNLEFGDAISRLAQWTVARMAEHSGLMRVPVGIDNMARRCLDASISYWSRDCDHVPRFRASRGADDGTDAGTVVQGFTCACGRTFSLTR